jgi:NADH dehydrogenase [ubiquinone] 1 alpha subcomplex assembly factor 6
MSSRLVRPQLVAVVRKNASITASTRRSYAVAASAAPSVGGAQNPIEYCSDLLRKHDRDSYLTAQFFPGALKPAALALKAFAVSCTWLKSRPKMVT